MMRKNKNTLAGLSVLLVGALCSSATMAQTTIIYGSGTTPTSSQIADGIVPWLEEAGRLSNGDLAFDVQAGGAVVTGTTDLAGVRDGLVDGSTIVTSYYADELPITGGLIPSLAFVNGDTRVLSGALTELILLKCPDCIEELKGQRVVPFGPLTTDKYELLCRSAATTLDQLRGLRVRVPGSAWNRLSAELGLVPVSLAVNEMYEALQRGTADCTFGSLNLLQTMSLGEVAKNVTTMPAGNLISSALFSLSLDFWQRLDAADQDALIDAASAGVAGQAYSYRAGALQVAAEADEHGYSIVTPEGELAAALASFVQKDMEEAIAAAEAKGVSNARDIANEFVALVDKWSGIVRSLPDDQEAFAQKLDEEIYSQFPRDAFAN